MMALLKEFAVFSLICSLLLTLLPEGSARRTAAMVVGLMLLLSWSEGLAALWPASRSTPTFAPAGILSATGLDIASASAEATQTLLRRMEMEP